MAVVAQVEILEMEVAMAEIPEVVEKPAVILVILKMEEIKAEMDKVAMKAENPGMVVILKAILMVITLMEIKAVEKPGEILEILAMEEIKEVAI